MSIAVVAPVLARPQSAQRLADSLQQSGANARLVFICSLGDADQIEASQAVADTHVVPWEAGSGDWARKINWALNEATTEEWLLLGADDLRFHPRWDKEALRQAVLQNGLVIGTNDLGNPYVRRGDLATHALVHRSYAQEFGTIDELGKILHEGYHHNWVDLELTETAKARKKFAFARRSIVEHLHPSWGKAPMDSTYDKALDYSRFVEDRNLLQRRRRLWIDDLRRVSRAAGRGARLAKPRRR